MLITHDRTTDEMGAYGPVPASVATAAAQRLRELLDPDGRRELSVRLARWRSGSAPTARPGHPSVE